MTNHPRRWIAAAAAVAVMMAAGCGDDGDEEADDDTSSEETTAPDADTASGESDVEAYCEASLALETAPEPDVDFETASEEEIAAALTTYANDVLQPAAADIEATAPEELADEVEVLTSTVDEIVATGDGSLMESPELTEASESAHAYDLANCGWATVDVAATEYAFGGIPDELDAGTTSFDLANDGAELHELLVVRKNDGVTQSAEELLALPEEEAMALVTMIGAPAFAPPGASSHMVAELEPGDYIAVCFIPTGTTDPEAPPPEGPPHAMQGMVAEFGVS